MRETEVEIEEREVERIYCDECGDECTKNFKVEPSEVCKSCSSETAVDRVKDLMKEAGGNGKDLTTNDMLILTLMIPLWILAIIFDNESTEEGGKIPIALILSGSIWTTIVILILFAIL
jgi:hypothetical protein